MEKRTLGSTGVELSVIGLGTWALGGGGWKFGWGPQDDKGSIAVIRRALELGVNWIDTAPLYGLGHAEKIVGRALEGVKDKPFIATKFGITWDAKRKMSHCLKRESIGREIEASLKRLKLDVIDLYQLHWPFPEEDVEEAWACAAGLVKEGKARFVGVCNCGAAQMEKLKGVCRPASSQSPYSALTRAVEREILPYCEKEGIGALAYGVLEKGLLCGGFSRQRIEALPMDDHRKRDPAFCGLELEKNLQAVRELATQALGAGMTPAQLAISRVLANRAVCSAIIGARSVKQLEENVLGK